MAVFGRNGFAAHCHGDALRKMLIVLCRKRPAERLPCVYLIRAVCLQTGQDIGYIEVLSYCHSACRRHNSLIFQCSILCCYLDVVGACCKPQVEVVVVRMVFRNLPVHAVDRHILDVRCVNQRLKHPVTVVVVNRLIGNGRTGVGGRSFYGARADTERADRAGIRRAAVADRCARAGSGSRHRAAVYKDDRTADAVAAADGRAVSGCGCDYFAAVYRNPCRGKIIVNLAGTCADRRTVTGRCNVDLAAVDRDVRADAASIAGSDDRCANIRPAGDGAAVDCNGDLRVRGGSERAAADTRTA